jgi:hypothetical protein
MLRFPHFLDNQLAALRAGHPLPPRKFQEYSWYSFLLEAESTPELEGLGKLKKSNDLIGIQSGNFLACSIVLQPTTPPRVPTVGLKKFIFFI